MTPIRVGFIGTGLIAGFHARMLSQVDTAVIVAAHDIDRSRSESFAKEWGGVGGITVTDSADELLDMVDAVYVCTWTSAHLSLVAAAVARSLPVFCEKPLAVDLPTAEAMTAPVSASGVTNQVGLILRRSPAFRWLHHQIHRPESGELMTIPFRDDQFIPIQGSYRSTWRADRDKAGADTLIEHSIHDLDLLGWMMDPVASVTAHTRFIHQLDGIEDQAAVMLVDANGAVAQLTSVWHDIMARPSQRRVEVFCRNGWFSVDGDWSGPVNWESDAGSGSLAGDELAAVVRGFDDKRQNADAAFIAAVRAGEPAHPDMAVALAAHRLCDAAYRSAAAGGTPIALP